MKHPHLNWRTGELCTCGFGKYMRPIRTASWEPGTWAQGLWWPQTDRVLIWADDRSHQDVEAADENASSGGARRFRVRPNGTVQAEDPNVPLEALQGAIEAFDPSLRVDHSPWDFQGVQSPTEPLPTFPESEDEGRKHNVQIRDDYQGYGT